MHSLKSIIVISKKIYFSITLTLLIFFGNAQISAIDSLLATLKIARHDTIKLTVLLQLTEMVTDEAIWPKYNAEAKVLGENLSKNLNKSIAKKGKIGLASAISNIGYLCEGKGDMPQALKHYLDALKIFESINYEQGMASSLNNIAAIYVFQNNTNKALEYCNKSLSIREKIGDKLGMSYTLDNIGTTYMNAHDNIKALDYYYRSLKLREEFGDSYMVSYSLNNIGSVYSAMDSLSKAIAIHLRSLKIREELNDKTGIAMSYANLTDIYFKQKKYAQAKLFAEKSLRLIEKDPSPRQLESIEGLLSSIDSASGDYKAALKHYQKHVFYRKQFVNLNVEKQLLEKQIQFDYEKKELLLNQEHKLAQEKLMFANKSLKTERIYILTLCIAIALIGILFFIAYKRKKKLSNQRGTLVREIHHRVKNNLQIVSSLLNLQTNSLTDQKAINALKESHNRIKTISLIHQKLYSREELSAIRVKLYVEQLFNQLQSVYQCNNIILNCRVDPENLALTSEISIPFGLIINELFTNTIKYAFPDRENGLITIDIQTQGGNCLVLYSDNGVGISSNIDFETSKTLGLRIMKELTRQLKGTISHKNQNGSFFEWSFPLEKTEE